MLSYPCCIFFPDGDFQATAYYLFSDRMDYLRIAGSALLNAVGLPGFEAKKQHSETYPRAVSRPTNDHLSPDDVTRIALLLCEKLPRDLVPLVLDSAQMWKVVDESLSLRPDRIGEHQGPKLQAALILPPHLPQGAVRRIRFTIESQDQGWSSRLSDDSTYRGSWTWFEAGIRGLDPSNADDQATLLAAVDCQHRNALDDEHKRLCLQNVTRYKYGSRNIVTNVHPSEDFVKHIVEWDSYHEDDGVRRMIKELKGGSRIEVSAHARFPGWCNYVKSVAIEVECAIVRRM